MNLPLGFNENLPFQSGRVQLLPGDRLVLYTDGLTEMPMSCKEDALRPQDLLEIIQDRVDREKDVSISALMAQLPAAAMKKGGAADGDIFHQNLYDDVTMVGLQLSQISGGNWKVFVPANYKGIDALIDAVFVYVLDAALCVGLNLDEFKTRMVLTEGVINAWKHGNAKSVDKPIAVGWQLGNDFSVFVKDQGDGFDYRQLKNPSHLANRLSECGRGIFCMRKYADYVGWQNEGTTLVLSFKMVTHPWEQVKRPHSNLIDLWRDPLPSMESESM